MSVSATSVIAQKSIPLPATPPPPPPPSSNPSLGATSYPPPPASAATSPAAYQAYYQQYYQYMYSTMYSNPAAMMQAYPMVNQAGGQAAVAAAMQGYYNYNPTSAASPPAPKPATVAPSPTQPKQAKLAAEPVEQPKPQIKINLKFQQQPQPHEPAETSDAKPTGRKSRFSTTASISNVISEQSKFKEQKKAEEKSKTEIKPSDEEKVIEKVETTESDSVVSEIVFDINKWPAALKSYCAKVYQHYQKISMVSEDQVTKYLQKRITDAFKLKPDLNIGWDAEPLPDIISIKKVAPFSQHQMQQQQRQQQALIQQKKQQILVQQNRLKQEALAAAQALKNTRLTQNASNSKFQSTLISSIKENVLDNKKRKARASSSSSRSSSSSSRSSSSSSRSSSKSRKATSTASSSADENFISFKKSNRKNVSNNLKRRASHSVDLADDIDDDDKILDEDRLTNTQNRQGVNLKNLNRKQRRRMLLQEKKIQQLNKSLNNSGHNNKNNFLVSRKFQNDSYSSLPVARKNMKNIFELAREQDMEQDEATHHKNICIGISQDLEKEYLRLTGPPEPHMVRPIDVLRRSLDYVLLKYSRTKDYRYICDQLKAIRQDLTVQQIRNEFTIQVYESHARIAIRNKDRDEFNQCQNQLKSLYNLVSSKTINDSEYDDNRAEFIGYRLLYNMLTKSFKDIDQVFKEIKQKYSANKNLEHLLELKKAWYLNNYVKFFKLYKKSSELCKCLIDLFIERERKQALKAIIKSFRPSIKLDIVSDMLAYESLDKCKTDLLEYKLNIIEDTPTPTHNNNKTRTITELYIDCKSCNTQNL